MGNTAASASLFSAGHIGYQKLLLNGLTGVITWISITMLVTMFVMISFSLKIWFLDGHSSNNCKGASTQDGMNLENLAGAIQQSNGFGSTRMVVMLLLV